MTLPDTEYQQRASLILQMANSVQTSNARRKRQLQKIEKGHTDNIQQVIDDIMHEKPVNLMDLLKEAEPEALPSTAELQERYQKKVEDETDDDDDYDDDKENEEDDDDMDKEYEEDAEEDEEEDDRFKTKEDLIMAEATAPPPVDPSIPAETLQAHTAPLQEQLKRSYAAIVKLRENSDLRYEALEKKYVELKREKQNHPDAFHHSGGELTLTPVEHNNKEGVAKEQLNQAYEAIVRLRENSDLRYNVLESKYLDLKRSHAESDARNERLEMDLEAMRLELLRVLNDPNNSSSLETSMLSSPSRRGGSSSNASLSSSKLDAHKSGSVSKENRKKRQEEKKKENKKQRLFLQEFHVLCDKIEDCEECHLHIPHVTLGKVKEQLAKIMDASFREEEEKEPNESSDADADSEREEEEEEEDENDTLAGSLTGSKRHESVMALLGPNWGKIAEIDERKLEQQKPGGRFANLREPKSQEKLRGKKSQFVAAQSGVYCRIDHDMQNQYGDLDKFEAPAKTPPPPPPPLPIKKSPPKDQTALPAPPAMKAATSPPVSVVEAPAPVVQKANSPPVGVVETIEKAENPQPAALSGRMDESQQTYSPPEVTRRLVSPTSVADLFFEGDTSSEKFGNLKRDLTPPRGAQQQPPQKSALKSSARVKKGSVSSARVKKGNVSFSNMEFDPEEDIQAIDNSQTQTPKQVFVPAVPGEKEATKSKLEDESERSASVASSSSLEGRVKKIPPARLDPAERKAKREAALKEAKAAAKSVRRQSRSNRKHKVDNEDSSLISGLSNVSSVAASHQPKSKGLFKNPFRKKSKDAKTSKGMAPIPQEIIDEAPAHPKKNRRKSTAVVVEKKAPSSGTKTRSRRQSAPPKPAAFEC